MVGLLVLTRAPSLGGCPKRAENRGEVEESLGPEREPRAEEAKTATPSVLSAVIGPYHQIKKTLDPSCDLGTFSWVFLGSQPKTLAPPLSAVAVR